MKLIHKIILFFILNIAFFVHVEVSLAIKGPMPPDCYNDWGKLHHCRVLVGPQLDEGIASIRSAFLKRDFEAAIVEVDQVINESYQLAHQDMRSLEEFPWASHKEIAQHWELNRTALAMALKAEAHINLGEQEEAKVILEDLKKNLFYGQCFLECGNNIFKLGEYALDKEEGNFFSSYLTDKLEHFYLFFDDYQLRFNLGKVGFYSDKTWKSLSGFELDAKGIAVLQEIIDSIGRALLGLIEKNKVNLLSDEYNGQPYFNPYINSGRVRIEFRTTSGDIFRILTFKDNLPDNVKKFISEVKTLMESKKSFFAN